MLKDFKLIENADDVGAVLNTLNESPDFALDLETTGLSYETDEIFGVALANADQEWFVAGGALVACLHGLQSLVRNKKVIFHNGMFDMHFLHNGVFNVRPVNIFDTMVAQALIDENQSLALKTLAQTKLGVEEHLPSFKDMLTDAKKVKKAKRLDQVNIFDIPMDKLSLYAGLDARLTYELYRKSMYELHQESMTKIFHDIEMPFLFVLMEMEEAGFFIDGTVLGELNVDFANQRDSAKGTFLSISDGVNPDSNPQVAKYLFETLKYKPSKKTESGAPSVDVMSLTRLLPKDKNGAVAALLAYRKYEKLLGTYIEPINERTQGGQLRLRGEFNQTGTVTGRLSSSNPNLQNIPARGDSGSRVRSLFSAPKGYSFLDADYSQLELRICAHYSQDPNLVKTFIEGGDPHQLTADLCGVDRSTGKTLNFGVLYGSGPKTMADTVEKSGKPRPTEETTKKWLQAFDKAYPTIVYMKQMQIMQAREQGYVETIGRRKRRLPDINNRDQSLRARAERQTSNSVIQGSAADIIKYAMLSIFPYMGDYDAKMTAQVHDELCFEVPEEAAPEFSEFVSNRMIGVGEYFDMLVPLEASPGIGKNWDEAKH